MHRKIFQSYVENVFKFAVTETSDDFKLLLIDEHAEEKASYLKENERALKMKLEFLPPQGSPLDKDLFAINSYRHTLVEIYFYLNHLSFN